MLDLSSRLPDPPLYHIEVVEDRSDVSGGFLTRKSRICRVRPSPGSEREEFTYDEVDRLSIDAVVVAAHFRVEREGQAGDRYVVLRSAIRPPVALRDSKRSPLEEPENRGLWELPAGLIDPEEQSPEGVRKAGVRELFEETGFEASPTSLRDLGPSAFPAPGICAERHFFFHVEVDPGAQKEPTLDGSPLEAAGSLIAVPLSEALRAAKEGALMDAKTELGLRRLRDLLEEDS